MHPHGMQRKDVIRRSLKKVGFRNYGAFNTAFKKNTELRPVTGKSGKCNRLINQIATDYKHFLPF